MSKLTNGSLDNNLTGWLLTYAEARNASAVLTGKFSSSANTCILPDLASEEIKEGAIKKYIGLMEAHRIQINMPDLSPALRLKAWNEANILLHSMDDIFSSELMIVDAMGYSHERHFQEQGQDIRAAVASPAPAEIVASPAPVR